MRVLLFGSEKCVPCLQLKKQFEKRGVKFKYIDVEKDEDFMSGYGITSVPTIIIEDSRGEVKDAYIGNGKGVWEVLKKWRLLKE